MRILKVTGGYPPAYAQGGTATAAHSLMKALKAIGNQVMVLTTNINGKNKLDLVGMHKYDGVDVCYCRASNSFLPYYSPELTKTLKTIAKDFDIVLLDSSWTVYGVSAGKILQKTGKPYIIYSHGCLDPERLKISKFKKKLWWMLFDKHLYNKAAAVVALTETEIQHLKNMGIRTSIFKIPNGVEVKEIDTKLVKSIIAKEFPNLVSHEYILYLGRFDPIKGIDILIDAYYNIRKKKGSDFPLLILAGPNNNHYALKIRKKVSILGLESDVIFTGLVTGEKKAALMKRAKLFVLPSKGEGLPVTALEALAYEIPVIITKKCYLSEVSKHKAGIEVEADNRSLAEAIVYAIKNYPEMLLMAKRGKDLVSRFFSWKVVAKETAKMCKAVLGGNK